MKPRRRSSPGRGEAGFSMIEMLMAAFILSIGILGLTMLQAMSMRMASGGHRMSMAVQLAERIMDQVEQEGRATYLNRTDTSQLTPGTLAGLTYITQTSVNQYFGLDPATGDPRLLTSSTGALFTVQMSQGAYSAGTGLSDVRVQVQFTDDINAATNTARPRTVILTRRILHG